MNIILALDLFIVFIQLWVYNVQLFIRWMYLFDTFFIRLTFQFQLNALFAFSCRYVYYFYYLTILPPSGNSRLHLTHKFDSLISFCFEFRTIFKFKFHPSIIFTFPLLKLKLFKKKNTVWLVQCSWSDAPWWFIAKNSFKNATRLYFIFKKLIFFVLLIYSPTLSEPV